MRLLVSLRAAAEVEAALAGGADIIDAKEPALGSLGPVSPEVLRAIAERVPEVVSLSIALGDMTTPDAVRRAVAAIALPSRPATSYLKFGFAGERSREVVASVVEAALIASLQSALRPVVVPVAYADAERAGSLPAEDVLDVAVETGARAMLVDTFLKDGSGLLDWIALGRLQALAARAHAAGMLFALAGGLDFGRLAGLAGVADVIGVRGAACLGGRGGAVDARLVQVLTDRLRSQSSAGSLDRDERALATASGRSRRIG